MNKIKVTLKWSDGKSVDYVCDLNAIQNATSIRVAHTVFAFDGYNSTPGHCVFEQTTSPVDMVDCMTVGVRSLILAQPTMQQPHAPKAWMSGVGASVNDNPQGSPVIPTVTVGKEWLQRLQDDRKSLEETNKKNAESIDWYKGRVDSLIKSLSETDERRNVWAIRAEEAEKENKALRECISELRSKQAKPVYNLSHVGNKGGLIIRVSGPSGSGKTVVMNRIIKMFEEAGNFSMVREEYTRAEKLTVDRTVGATPKELPEFPQINMQHDKEGYVAVELDKRQDSFGNEMVTVVSKHPYYRRTANEAYADAQDWAKYQGKRLAKRCKPRKST